ncbi:MAG: hypothetical protein J1F65_04255 [Clostridiales bacterium]|nr:hypothetical protein [Clostridiales bacterium]
MSVCIVSFSSRKNGNCDRISEFVSSLYPNAKRYNFSKVKVNACGDCKYQCFERGDKCPHARDKEREILDAITNSELSIFIVPNYCDYPCSNYFVFNERGICYFQKNDELLTKYLEVPKKFIVVSNTNQDHFRQAFRYQTSGEPDVLFLAAYEHGKISTDGDLITSSEVTEDLREFLDK